MLPFLRILCETCYWCAKYFDKSRIPTEKCLICLNTEMSSFSILSNEAFTFNYNDKPGVELELDFRPGGRRNKNENQYSNPIALKGKKRKIIIIIFYSSILVFI